MNFRNSAWQNSNQSNGTAMRGNHGNNSYSQNSGRSGSNSGSNNFFNSGSYPNSTPGLTPEQLAFENEFSKWESSFAEWKRAYADHPDQSAFREYEKKFLDIRDKLLIKRTRVYGSNNTHSEFEAHLNAASSMAEHLLNFDESPTRPSRYSNHMISGQQNNSNRFSNQQQQDRFSNQGNSNRFNPYQVSNAEQRFKKQPPGGVGNFLRSSSQVSNNQNNWKTKQNVQPTPKKKKTPGVAVQQAPVVHTVEDIEQKFEEARKEISENKCPRFSGASRRKLTRLKERQPSTYDEAEKLFMDYAAFVHKERHEFLQKKNPPKPEGEPAAAASCPMETQNTGPVGVPAPVTVSAQIAQPASVNFTLD